MKPFVLKRHFLVLSTLALLLLIPAARSQSPFQVYNSFGPGNTYNTQIAWAVSGVSASPGYRGQAQFFVPNTSGYLDQILLATVHESGSALGNFFIAQDNGSGIPGSILESWYNVGNPNGDLTLTSTSPVLLQGGQEYWLCDEPAAANSFNAWYQNNQNISPGDAYENSEWNWNTIPGGIETAGVFAISATPVPEPSTMALLLFGLAFVGIRGLRITRSKLSPAWKL